jgi:tripartite-type tricarboxylate transporter receptor subunit TctC
MPRLFPALLAALAIAASALMMPAIAVAQNYPSKPVRLIVPFPPGGGNDVIARFVAPQVEAQIKQPVVIDNRAGAQGIIGTQAVATAEPDGYTLMHNSAGMIINKYIYKSLPYDIFKDLVPVANVAEASGYVVVVNPKLPIHNIADLIDYAKKNDTFYGSSGPGSPIQLGSELFNVRAGTKISGVQYRGTGPALAAVLSGAIQVMLAPPGNVLGQVKAGALRAIAFTGSKPLAEMPDLPLAKATVPTYEFTGAWQGWFAPAGTPPHIVDYLNKQVRAAVKAPKVAENLAKVGYVPQDQSPAEFAAYFKADDQVWAEAVRAAKIEPQ